MKKTNRLLIAFCLYGQFMSACGQSAHPVQAETDKAAKESQHKVVQVDWRAQLADIQEKLVKSPNSAFLHNQAAVAYDALDELENFDREIHIAMKLDPGNPSDAYAAYAVYKRRHLRDKQTSALEQALQADPSNPTGHYEKGSMLEDDKKWVEALAEYQITKRLVDRVKANPDNFKNNRWTYVDLRGNPFDVSWEMAHIDDIARVRAAIQGQK